MLSVSLTTTYESDHFQPGRAFKSLFTAPHCAPRGCQSLHAATASAHIHIYGVAAPDALRHRQLLVSPPIQSQSQSQTQSHSQSQCQPQPQFQSKQPPAVASELERTVVRPRVADKLLKHAVDEFK